MATAHDLLRPGAASHVGTFGHGLLKTTFILDDEIGTAGVLQEQPHLVVEIRGVLRILAEGFISTYDPGAFVLELPSLAGLDEPLRARLLDAVWTEYAQRFQPAARLADLCQRTEAFLGDLDAWTRQVSASDIGSESSPLWAALQASAEVLRQFLENPELARRWIP